MPTLYLPICSCLVKRATLHRSMTLHACAAKRDKATPRTKKYKHSKASASSLPCLQPSVSAFPVCLSHCMSPTESNTLHLHCSSLQCLSRACSLSPASPLHQMSVFCITFLLLRQLSEPQAMLLLLILFALLHSAALCLIRCGLPAAPCVLLLILLIRCAPPPHPHHSAHTTL